LVRHLGNVALNATDKSLMLVTVGICTFNRAESLRRTLDSLASMRIPAGLDWEILVVNSGTDHTPAGIAHFAGRLPVRLTAEGRLELSHARNQAIDAARGEYILWTDDDVVVGADWLAAYVDAFQRWPEAALFGAHIVPRFEVPVPRWLADSKSLLGFAYAVRDFGSEALPLSIAEDRLPFGANYAVRTAEAREFRYNPGLGAAPGRLRVGEESDIIKRIMRAGALGYWLPDAPVEHCIGRERKTERYLVRYYASHGATDAFLRGDESPQWLGVPRWLWRRLPERWLRYRLHRLFSPAPVWVKHLTLYAYDRGTFQYWRNAHR